MANVYATGSFTIPLMKKGGYTAKNAAAIEAIAGTGGQIMPPVMGAGVFIMSEVTGISYFEIIKAAAIPAILYYVGLMAMVHFLALRVRHAAGAPVGAALLASGAAPRVLRRSPSASSCTCWLRATRRPGPRSTRSW